MVALSSGGIIDELRMEPDTAANGDSAGGFGLKERVDAFERGIIAQELSRCSNNRSEAARRLGVARVTLLEKMKKYGLG